ncbi:MAG: hypothetical protein JO099_01510 [Acidobacteriia bacterium]|nr:hypothetical protein [Terriglobia bacterium]
MHGDRWVVVDTREFQGREEALAYEKRAKRPANRVKWVEKNIDRIKEIIKGERLLFPGTSSPEGATVQGFVLNSPLALNVLSLLLRFTDGKLASFPQGM